MKRFACLLLAVLLTVSLCGCGGTQESRLELFAMDTYMVITAEGGDTEEAVRKSVDVVRNHPVMPPHVRVAGFIMDSETGELLRVAD